MKIELVAQVAIAVFGLASAALPLIGARAKHRALQEDLASIVALLDALPEQSSSRRTIEGHLEGLAVQLIDRSQHRRDPVGITLALIFISMATAAGIAAASAGGIWWWALIPVTMVFILGGVGLASDATKRKRDARGRPARNS